MHTVSNAGGECAGTIIHRSRKRKRKMKQRNGRSKLRPACACKLERVYTVLTQAVYFVVIRRGVRRKCFADQ
ncbi:hypothetical protein M752DRAFT_81743 [Aspergillus phoenicis ATCC 13157]|uniref:Uncharacterized protein n=1 Tax=Aspergillus phoenicis ATCC 13157 TaxID=1353007 RepID=A0A370P7J7_ASPPH|nr:hypothetical protein M752DRAFT_81743 [Aspergillus phoenicis ATCC 13157]